MKTAPRIRIHLAQTLVIAICLIFSAVSCFPEALPASKPLPSESFRNMLDDHPEIELLLRMSIRNAAEINPDRATNPRL